jgi:hypothetical protein
VILDSRPTTAFLGRCEPCVRPVRAVDEQAGGRYAALTCPQCSGSVTGERLHATTNAELCNGACMGAAGPSCSCACGGANHGRVWQYAGEETETALMAYRARIAEQDAARERRDQAERRRRRATFDAWADEHRDIVDYLTGAGADIEPGDFLDDMAGMVERLRPLTPAQAAAVRRCIAGRIRVAEQRAAEAAAACPVPTGDAVTITGRVAYVRSEDNPYGRGFRCTMLVKGNGWQVWSTIPNALISAAGHYSKLKDQRVRFVAAITAKDGEPSTGNAKRPRRAEILAEQATDLPAEQAVC